PGPSAALAALVVSGLPVHQFTYLGFLPRSRGERRRELSSVAGDGRTLVAFEAPHRVRESLQDIVEIMGNRRIAVCREMTKLHEEIFRGTVEEALGRFSQPRGEFTVVIAGRERARGSDGVSQALQDEVESLCGQGMRLKEAVAFVAGASGVSRRLLYDTCIKDRSKS
ncbi:MAG: 16S rRNA (cytidine(1402)-2'-O)-methyltransferase, partial [Chloroflexi bacterium]|nr:16S rRNA (cytidine(1402)-2'-O)-methyltransferase [Chloroflexota bacterium]